MNLRPSSMPMFAACPCFDRVKGDTSDTKAGTLRHDYLAAVLRCEIGGNDGADVELCQQTSRNLPEDDVAAVDWAADYIKCHSPVGEPMRIERNMALLNDDFSELMRGTPDAVCGSELFDLKWRERDYTAQMTAYALMRFQEDNLTEIRVHVLFAERRHAEVFTLTEESARKIIDDIIATLPTATVAAMPKACDYCDWCSKQMTCPATTGNAKTIASHHEEISPADLAAFNAWLEGGAHSSQVTDAKLMGAVLRIAKQLSGWCESVEHHAKEMATKQGVVPHGFKIQTRKGNRQIESVEVAFGRAGLPQSEFLQACDVKFSALVEVSSKVNGIAKAQAERTMEEKLGDALTRKASTISLVVDKSTNK